MEALKFEQLPNEVAELKNEVREMKALLLQKVEPKSEADYPINIKGASEITGLTVPTLYGYCQRNEIPHNKKANRLFFFKKDLIDWIKAGKQKTLIELQEDAKTYFLNKRKELYNGK